MPRHRRAVPAWLAHPFRWQRLPVPWAAVARGALCAGPLLAAGIATGHPAPGVLIALGSMLAGVNDRPGTRRTGIVHIGLPALAAALGMLTGASLRAADAGWWVVPALAAVGFVSGAGSVAGPVRSTAAMQMLAATVLGAGMPLPGAPWAKALAVLAGCLWLLLLRLVLRTPRPAGGPLHGERAAVATVFDALADALEAVGGPGAEPARRRLTAALDRADEALRLRRLTDRLLRRPARPRNSCWPSASPRPPRSARPASRCCGRHDRCRRGSPRAPAASPRRCAPADRPAGSPHRSTAPPPAAPSTTPSWTPPSPSTGTGRCPGPQRAPTPRRNAPAAPAAHSARRAGTTASGSPCASAPAPRRRCCCAPTTGTGCRPPSPSSSSPIWARCSPAPPTASPAPPPACWSSRWPGHCSPGAGGRP